VSTPSLTFLITPSPNQPPPTPPVSSLILAISFHQSIHR
jgi:hypothetical protein